MEDLHAAGGAPAVLRALRDHLNLEVATVTGQTLGEAIDAADPWVDAKVIRPVENPISPQGGLVALSGTLAPKGAILKRAAATPALFEREGRAVVFTSLEDLSRRIDDPALDVTPAAFLVLQNPGPLASGLPEADTLPIPAKPQNGTAP